MPLPAELHEAPAISQPVPFWRNRDYLLLFGGQMVSNVGSEVSLLAFPLLVLFLTGSPAQAGIIGALRGLPYFVLGLPAGALVDRWDRKRVMILCDSGRAASGVRAGCHRLDAVCATGGAGRRHHAQSARARRAGGRGADRWMIVSH